MVNKTFGLLFYLKKPKQYEKGALPIYLRLTVDGRRAEVATKRSCEAPEKWNSAAGRMTGNKEAIKILNAHLDILQSKVYETYKDLLQEGKTITAEAIKNKLQGVTERPKMFLDIFRFHNEGVKTLMGNGFSPQTYKRYQTALQHTREFMQWKYRVSDLAIAQLSVEFITEFEFYLRSAFVDAQLPERFITHLIIADSYGSLRNKSLEFRWVFCLHVTFPPPPDAELRNRSFFDWQLSANLEPSNKGQQ